MKLRRALERIHAECQYEPHLAEAAGKVLSMDEGLWPTALERIRAKTRSMLLQDHITEALGDDWVATPENSEVQPYESSDDKGR